MSRMLVDEENPGKMAAGQRRAAVQQWRSEFPRELQAHCLAARRVPGRGDDAPETVATRRRGGSYQMDAVRLSAWAEHDSGNSSGQAHLRRGLHSPVSGASCSVIGMGKGV